MNLGDLATRLDIFFESGVWAAPLTALIGAFVFGQILAWTYERTYRGLSYSRGFSHTLVLVCISAAILVLSMQYSLIAGLGLFGILSMIHGQSLGPCKALKSTFTVGAPLLRRSDPSR